MSVEVVQICDVCGAKQKRTLAKSWPVLEVRDTAQSYFKADHICQTCSKLIRTAVLRAVDERKEGA